MGFLYGDKPEKNINQLRTPTTKKDNNYFGHKSYNYKYNDMRINFYYKSTIETIVISGDRIKESLFRHKINISNDKFIPLIYKFSRDDIINKFKDNCDCEKATSTQIVCKSKDLTTSISFIFKKEEESKLNDIVISWFSEKRMAFNKAKNINDCNLFLKKYPNGDYKNTIKIKKELLSKKELAFFEQTKSDNIDNCNNYLLKYANGQYVSEVGKLKKLRNDEEVRKIQPCSISCVQCTWLLYVALSKFFLTYY